MIKAVLFDLFETLVTEQGTMPSRASSLGAVLGIDGAAFRTAWKRQRPRVLRGHLSFADALVEIGVRLGTAVDPAVVQSVCELRVREKRVCFQQIPLELIAVVRRLHEQGIKLAVVSNCFPEDVDAWSGCAVARYFDTTVFSFEAGVVKPEPRIYLEAVRRIGVEPTHTLFVGDGGDDELLGAERVGLRPVRAAWFDNAVAGELTSAAPPCVAAWRDILQLVAAE